MKEYKKITYGELDGVLTAEVMAGKGDSIFVDKIRWYKNLTPSTIGRLTKLPANASRYSIGFTKWGVSVTRRLNN